MQWLNSGVQQLGFRLTPGQVQQFSLYRQELIAWNRRVNLTAITEPVEIERLHFLDSLTVALALPQAVLAGGRILDVGSGAGFPGVPLKVLFPSLKLTLIESRAKRTEFLVALVAKLGLEGVDILTGRSEDLAHDAPLREGFDVVVSRGVAPLRILLEFTLPFCCLGGQAILQKKGDIMPEVAEATGALGELGGRLLKLETVPEEVLDGQRKLVVVEKVAPTPAKYPRRAGIPAKRPL
ncbi:MAG: 16S rRNA (guanine(527)-N(7))-methyltransferase RsmG [Dehalococcoidia bacterium]